MIHSNRDPKREWRLKPGDVFTSVPCVNRSFISQGANLNDSAACRSPAKNEVELTAIRPEQESQSIFHATPVRENFVDTIGKKKRVTAGRRCKIAIGEGLERLDSAEVNRQRKIQLNKMI